jgi:hypothetical protein
LQLQSDFMNLDHSPSRLALPQVTLCAVTSVNVAATVRALEQSMAQIDFAACKLLTDAEIIAAPKGIEVIKIPRLTSAEAYSDFVLRNLGDYIDTSHCLITQWDGHVVNASKWQASFLDFDYIGARWPQFADGHDVGNGGFSLRSLRLMEACKSPEFQPSHPEDVAIGRINRDWLEGRGMHFASGATADSFSAERTGSINSSFGFHGVWHMPRVIGSDGFWDVYSGLDDRSTIRHDLFKLAAMIAQSRRGLRRSVRLMVDQLCDAIQEG